MPAQFNRRQVLQIMGAGAAGDASPGAPTRSRDEAGKPVRAASEWLPQRIREDA